MIISKPRQIRIDLDPDQGFPVAVSLESIRCVEEDGAKVADLPPHVETVAADSEQVAEIMGSTASAATAALVVYQQEAQRLAHERDMAIAKLKELEARGVK